MDELFNEFIKALVSVQEAAENVQKSTEEVNLEETNEEAKRLVYS